MTQSRLKVLDFSNDIIKANGIAGIIAKLKAQPPAQIRLNLWGNEIGDQGVKHCADLLSHLLPGSEIDLSDNQISDKGLGYIVDALQKPGVAGNLCISLEENNITDAGAKKLGSALKTGYLPPVAMNLHKNKINRELNSSTHLDLALNYVMHIRLACLLLKLFIKDNYPLFPEPVFRQIIGFLVPPWFLEEKKTNFINKICLFKKPSEMECETQENNWNYRCHIS